MTIASRFAFLRILAVIVVVAVAADAEMPDSVSPGAVDHIAAIEGRCPSFSWGLVPGAEHYQLVCYRLPEGMESSEVDLERAEQVLSIIYRLNQEQAVFLREYFSRSE